MDRKGHLYIYIHQIKITKSRDWCCHRTRRGWKNHTRTQIRGQHHMRYWLTFLLRVVNGEVLAENRHIKIRQVIVK
jgi:hypothetical protein